jgi:hypothetical protein
MCTCVKCQNTKSICKKYMGWINLYQSYMSHMNVFPWNSWPNYPNGMDAIFVVVDRTSKLAKLGPTKMITIIFDSTKLVFDMWVKHHGMPQFIMNDRHAKFTTGFWKHLFRKVGTKLSFSTTFHPQTNGQTKRVNTSRIMWTSLRNIEMNI